MDNAWPTPVLFHQAPRLVQRSEFDSKESFEGLCLLYVALLLHQPRNAQNRVHMEPLDDHTFRVHLSVKRCAQLTCYNFE